jgi:hypothetical protein
MVAEVSDTGLLEEGVALFQLVVPPVYYNSVRPYLYIALERPVSESHSVLVCPYYYSAYQYCCSIE